MELTVATRLICTVAVAFLISLIATPAVKKIAVLVGAIDVPDNQRRIHDHPIPRMGGLAIFFGLIVSVLLFADIDTQLRGILVGCLLIVGTGIVDDIVGLTYWIKLIAQILAAAVAVCFGVVIESVTNPFLFSNADWLHLGWLSIPLTILWIVGVTNAINLIDGLDGLAAGVSCVSSLTMMATALFIPAVNANVPVILAATAGSCLGFLPYNANPAKIFMGDTGALLLGYILATVSVMGLFKLYAIVTFIIPIIALALPLLDTFFAIVRRTLKGQNPLKPDRGHLHHILMDMGLNQKQTVAILYAITAILGSVAVLMAETGEVKLLFLVAALIVSFFIALIAIRKIKK